MPNKDDNLNSAAASYDQTSSSNPRLSYSQTLGFSRALIDSSKTLGQQASLDDVGDNNAPVSVNINISVNPLEGDSEVVGVSRETAAPVKIIMSGTPPKSPVAEEKSVVVDKEKSPAAAAAATDVEAGGGSPTLATNKMNGTSTGRFINIVLCSMLFLYSRRTVTNTMNGTSAGRFIVMCSILFIYIRCTDTNTMNGTSTGRFIVILIQI